MELCRSKIALSAFADRTKFIWREVQREEEERIERERETVCFLGRNLVLAKFLTTHVRFFYIYDGLVF